MTTVLLLATGEVESRVLSALETADIAVLRCLDAVDLLARIASDHATVVIVDGPRPDVDTETVARIEEHRLSGIAVTTSPAGRAWATSLGFGAVLDASEIAVIPERVRESARARGRTSAPPPASSGRLIAVWGPVGAPGRSTVAINVAAELARSGRRRVLLADADTYGASVAQHLGLLDDVSGLLAASRAAHHGGDVEAAGFLDAHVARLAAGLDLLTGLPRANLWRHVRPRAWQRVLDAALATYDTTVIDVGFGLEPPDEHALASQHRHHVALDAVARADTVLAVSAADPVGLARLVHGLDDFGELGIDADIRIVINRHDPSTGWPVRHVEDTLVALAGRRPAAVLPFDHGTAAGAVAAARTVREHDAEAPLTRAIDAFARTL